MLIPAPQRVGAIWLERCPGKLCQQADSVCCSWVPSSDLAVSSSGGPIHSAAFLSCADDEAMATDVTPPASAELTELGKCLMKQEVRACFHCHHPFCALFVMHLCGADSLLQHPQCGKLLFRPYLFLEGCVNCCESHKALRAWNPV